MGCLWGWRDNNSYVSTHKTDKVCTADGKCYNYNDVFVDEVDPGYSNTCGQTCYVACSCNTSNGWYSSCQGSDCFSVTDTRYAGQPNAASASRSLSDVASISASGVNSGISAMAAGATTCYKKKTCSEGGYYDSEPAGQTCTSVNYNGLTCYKDCQDKCGDGNAYYTISLENNPYGSSWDPIVNLNWDSKKSDPCVIDGTKGSMEAKFEIWCPTDCTGPSLQSGDATVDIDITHPGDYTIPSNGNAWCPSGTSSPDILWNGCIINAGSCNPMNQDCKSVTRVNNTNWVAETTQGAKFHYTLTTKPVYYDCNGTLNGTWVEWDNSDNPEMLYHCCCPTRLDKYDSSCCTLDSECPDGYYEDEPNSSYFEYKTSANGNCYKVTGCAAGYTPVSTSSGYTSITTSGTTYDYHGFKCYEQSCPDGWFESRPDIRCFDYEMDEDTLCYRATGCRSGSRECGPKGYLTSNGITCYTDFGEETTPTKKCECKLTVKYHSSDMYYTDVTFAVSLSGTTCKSNQDEFTVEFPGIGQGGTSTCPNASITDHLTLSKLYVGVTNNYHIISGSGCHFMDVNQPGHKSYIVKINGVQASAAGGSSFKATDGSKCYLSYDGNF